MGWNNTKPTKSSKIGKYDTLNQHSVKKILSQYNFTTHFKTVFVPFSIIRVQNTRRAKKVKDEEGGNTFLSDLMVHQLEECGFKWGEPKGEKNWEKRFQSLKMFAQSTGHCNFPTRPDIGENHEPAVMEWIQKDPRQAKKLGRWVSEQRKNYRHGDLEQSKISRLNDIGFNWELKRTMKDGTGGV